MPTPQITITGNLENLLGQLDNGGSVVFTLVGYGPSDVPRVATAGVIVLPTVTALAPAGSFSVTLWGNDVITPANTFYQVDFFADNGAKLQTVLYQFTGSGSLDLSNVAPLNTLPSPSPITAPPNAVLTNPTAGQTITGQPLTVTSTVTASGFITVGSVSAGSIAAATGAFSGALTAGSLTAGAVSALSYNGVVEADTQPGADAGAKINNCLKALPSQGGICDARGLTGVQSGSINWWNGVTASSGTLLLGCMQYTQSTNQIIQAQRWHVVGCQRGDTTPAGTRIIASAGSPPPTSAVWRMGDGTFDAFDTTMEDLTIDCNNVASMIGVWSTEINEKSGLRSVVIANCLNIGANLDGTGPGGHSAQNFFLDDVEVLPGASATTSTIGIKYVGNTGVGPGHWRNITVNGTPSRMGTGILVANTLGGSLSHLHCEFVTTCLQIGDATAGRSQNYTVVDVNSANIGVGNNIVVLNNSSTGGINLFGISSDNAGNTLVDNADSLAANTDFVITAFMTSQGNIPGTSQRAIFTTNSSIASELGNVQIISNNNVAARWRDNGGSIHNILQLASDNNVYLDAGPVGMKRRTVDGATTFESVDSSGNVSLPVGLASFANNKGIQAFNVTNTCTTAASAGSTCTTAAQTLPVGYSDSNYRISCTGQGATNQPVLLTIVKSNTSFTITIGTITSAASSYSSYDCIAAHN